MDHKKLERNDVEQQKYTGLDERLQMAEEIENEVARRIIESGKKSIVPDLIYGSHFDPSDCTHCMNYNFEDDTCKKDMPNINTECEEWDYIYETKK